MAPVGLYDRLELQLPEEKTTRITCSGFSAPDNESNLAFKAAKAFLSFTGIEKGVRIHLVKSIPVAAGLGGGSSDAACVLKALNEIFASPVSEKEMTDMALELGADVPFFLHGVPCIAQGIGEILTPVQGWPKLWYLIVMPPIAVSTAWAYAEFDRYASKNRKKNAPELELTMQQHHFIMPNFRGEKSQLDQLLENDLESVTVPAFPIIDVIKTFLLEAGADGVLMSGSGPSVFGVFRRKDRCFEAKKFLQAKNAGEVFAVEGLLGCRQAVRHGPLEPAFGGSNPPTPANERAH